MSDGLEKQVAEIATTVKLEGRHSREQFGELGNQLNRNAATLQRIEQGQRVTNGNVVRLDAELIAVRSRLGELFSRGYPLTVQSASRWLGFGVGIVIGSYYLMMLMGYHK